MNKVAIETHIEHSQAWITKKVQFTRICPITAIFIDKYHHCDTKIYPLNTKQEVVEKDIDEQVFLRNSELLIVIYPSKILRNDSIEVLEGYIKPMIDKESLLVIDCVVMSVYDIKTEYCSLSASEVICKDDKFLLGTWKEYDFDTLELKGERF